MLKCLNTKHKRLADSQPHQQLEGCEVHPRSRPESFWHEIALRNGELNPSVWELAAGRGKGKLPDTAGYRSPIPSIPRARQAPRDPHSSLAA